MSNVLVNGGALNTTSPSGSAMVNTKKQVYCMDNVAEGVTLCRLDTGAHVKMFAVPVKKKHRARKVAFVDDCKTIVSGSDHGTVYAFDRRTGEREELSIGSDAWVQTILVFVITILLFASTDVGVIGD